jgi:serine/threonine protein kinase
LIRVFEAGRGEAGGAALAYVVMEYPEEELAPVLQERPLAPDEVRQALTAILEGLSYLHSRGFVHGSLEPRNILAIGNLIKLSTGNLHPPGHPGSSLTPADDLQSLGLCLYEMLTQQRDLDAVRLAAIPQPFQEIIRGCVLPDPSQRWTLARVQAALSLAPQAAAAPPAPERPDPGVAAAPAVAAAPTRSFRQPSTEKRLPVWYYVAAAVGVLAVMVWLAKPSGQTPSTSPSRQAPAPGAAVPAPAAAPAPSPSAPEPVPERAKTPPLAAPSAAGPAVSPPPIPTSRPATPSPGGPAIWRVIVYTYDRRGDAELELARLRRRWPQLHPEIFAPNGDAAPFFISLGGRMTYAEAVALQQSALSKGLPKDLFVRNYAQ